MNDELLFVGPVVCQKPRRSSVVGGEIDGELPWPWCCNWLLGVDESLYPSFGTHKLRFQYRKPWEKETEQEQQ